MEICTGPVRSGILRPSLANFMPPYFDFIDGANLQRPTYLEVGSTHTAGCSAPNPPPARQIPSHIVVDPQLLQKMRGSLSTYLSTKCGVRLVPDRLVTRLDLARQSLVNPPNLTNGPTAVGFFWEHVKPLVSEFVFDVDGVAIQLEEADASHGAKPDGIWGTRVHVEFKSARALLHHASEIFAIGRANNGKGSALELRQLETGARSIIFRVFLPISSFLLLLNDLSDWYKHGQK
jgi:hypothetical protein